MNLIEPGLSLAMKEQLKDEFQQLTVEIEHLLNTIDSNRCCVLNEFEEIHSIFDDIHTTAASYYLKSYLAPFSDRFEALSAAVQHLSERKHGALMVIKRNEDLTPFIHSGITVNATLSFSLLESIFYPGSPLHDGAVLIDQNTIVSAGNVLPVSKYFAGERKLGTRHRAAIGLSEKTDALIIVVSEETGQAAFALEGKLYPIHPGRFIRA